MSTLTASFGDDVRTYAAAGLSAIGIWELKLGDGPDDEALEAFRASGLGAATAVPAVPSIMPLPLLAGPDDPRERIDAILRSIARAGKSPSRRGSRTPCSRCRGMRNSLRPTRASRERWYAILT